MQGLLVVTFMVGSSKTVKDDEMVELV